MKTDGLRRTGTLMRSGPFFFLVSGMKCVVGEREKKKVTMPEEVNWRRGVNPIISKYCKNHGEKMGAKNAESGRKAMLNDGPCSRSARREMGSDKHKENISAHSPGQSVCRLDCLGTVDQTAIDFNP